MKAGHFSAKIPGQLSAEINRRGQLSRGEQQMLAIVRALLKGSKLVMLDEPVEGLAPIEINEIVEQLGRCGQVASILLVEQNLAVCIELADRHYVYQGSRSEFTAYDGIGVAKCRPGTDKAIGLTPR